MTNVLAVPALLGKSLWAVALNGTEAMSRGHGFDVSFKSEHSGLDC